MASLVSGLVRSARPHQWTKNVLVFAAPIAGGVLDEADVALRSVGAFVAFCLAAGGTYLLNDALDVEADRRHATKRHRPIAAGDVPLGVAFVAAGILIVAAVAVSFAIAPALGITTLAYLVLTSAYSFALKHIAVVDLVAVVAGFVLRAVAGAAATDIPISEWFFIVVSAGALLMITGKREAELATAAPERSGPSSPVGSDTEDATTRAVLSAYSPSFLHTVRSVAAGLALIAYCLWAFDPAAPAGAEVWIRASIAPFTIAILRYALLIDSGQGEEPDKLVLHDRTLLLSGAAWAIIYAYAIYLA